MKFKFLLFAISFLILPFSVEAVTLNLFYGAECPHCEAEMEFLDEISKEYGDDLEIKKFEVWHDENNNDLLVEVRDVLNNDDKGVPFTVIGNVGITGYNTNTESQIRDLIDKNLEDSKKDIVSYVIEGKEISSDMLKGSSSYEKVTVPILGEVSATDVSLPLLAMVLGIVDGFNPCAMWVLLFLITMLIQMKNKKRMMALGLTFLVTSALVYLLFMVAWLSLAITAMEQIFLRSLVALVALIAGIINLRSYFKTRNNPSGCEVTNDGQRQKIFSKIRKLTSEKSFFLALIGVITLAFTVNLIELACSAGLPLLFTSVLALNDLSAFEYGMNIGIYILFFLLDDIIVFLVAMKTLEVTGVSTKYSKYSHLIGGIIMILIGLLLFFKPEWIMLNF